jgi:hypothetical protein
VIAIDYIARLYSKCHSSTAMGSHIFIRIEVPLFITASNIFDMGDGRHARLFLEEDATEINNISAMILSHDKTFMILDKDKVWKPVSFIDEETLKYVIFKTKTEL